jgi:hypothetical protein
MHKATWRQVLLASSKDNCLYCSYAFEADHELLSKLPASYPSKKQVVTAPSDNTDDFRKYLDDFRTYPDEFRKYLDICLATIPTVSSLRHDFLVTT